MPIYEYRCQKCGEDVEALQGINDPPLKVCEKCGGELRKRLSAPAFQFKGSGWYVTDYARKDAGKKSSESSSEGGDSGKSSDDSAAKTGSSDKEGAKESSSKDTSSKGKEKSA